MCRLGFGCLTLPYGRAMLHPKALKEKGIIMSKRSFFGISGAVLLAFAPPSFADVTPEQVWQNWQELSLAAGQVISADKVSRDGDSLVVQGLQISMMQQGANAEGRMKELRFTDAGDGTVVIALPPNYPITMTLSESPRQFGPIQIAMEITQDDVMMTASGDQNTIKYDLSAPNLKIKLIRIDGLSAQSDQVTGEMTLADIQGSYLVTNTADVSSDFTIGGMALALVGADSSSEFRMTAAMQDLTMTSAGQMLHLEDLADALTQGAANSSKFTAAKSDFDLEVVDAKGVTAVKGTLDSVQMTTAIDSTGLDYALDHRNLALSIAAPEMPVADVALGFDALSFGLQMPVTQGDTAEPFGFQSRLTNMTLSDQIWSMFDPTAALPRDPMNLVIDADGMMKITADPAPQEVLPAQIESLNLNEFKLSLAGTELTGTGTGAMRYPAGRDAIPSADLNFKLLGANALMDRLVASGFLQADEMMVPRMILAMIAQPDPAGGDALMSRIEIKDQGIFANGQKLYDLP
jgi:hypothetical protein